MKTNPFFPHFAFVPAVPLLALTLAAGGCATSDEDNYHAIGRAAARSGTDPHVFQVKDDDRQMAQATQRARKNVGTFIAALRQPTAEQRDFAVKKKFVQGEAVEHLWLTGVRFTGNRFVGTVDNRPREIKNLPAGTRVSVNPDEISDWAYVDKGVLVGGYTVRALLIELSPQEREEFAKTADFRLRP